MVYKVQFTVIHFIMLLHTSVCVISDSGMLNIMQLHIDKPMSDVIHKGIEIGVMKICHLL